MAVGSRFNDPDTQAAIAAQAGTPSQPAPATQEATQATPAVEDAKPTEEAHAETTTSEETAPEAAALETPAQETESQDESADADLNMDNVKVPPQEEVDKALEEAGFSNEALGKELAENDGKLSAETVAGLKEHFDATAVDNAVADLEANFAKEAAPIKEKAEAANNAVEEMNTYIKATLADGDVEKGEQNLKILSDWARDNIPADQLEVINAKLASGNKVVVKEGLETAVNLWKKGQERPMMNGDSAASNKVDTTPKVEPLSKDQYIAIMATDKYNTDLEYQKQIDERRRATMAKESFVTPEYSASRPPIR